MSIASPAAPHDVSAVFDTASIALSTAVARMLGDLPLNDVGAVADAVAPNLVVTGAAIAVFVAAVVVGVYVLRAIVARRNPDLKK